MKEKRKYERISYEINVRMEQAFIDDGLKKYNTCTGRSLNLSPGGILIELPKEMILQKPIQLIFILPQRVELFKTIAEIIEVEKISDELYVARLKFFQTHSQEMILANDLGLMEKISRAA
ncbi:MAG: PilZ domain-containing protein [bacterium]|nr:PilZ domain-containing protein [bacterium]